MKKSILILLPNLLYGGSERVAANLSVALEEEYNVYMGVFDSKGISYQFGGKLVDFHCPPSDNKLKKIQNILIRIQRVSQFIKKNQIDIVFSFNFGVNIVTALLPLKVKKIISCRGFEELSLKYHRYHRQLKRSDALVFNSKYMKNYYDALYPKDAGKTYAVYNFVDFEKIENKAKNSVTEEVQHFIDTHKTIVTVGQFSLAKGHWNLIKSFEILKEREPQAGLIFIGNRGKIEKEIYEMAQSSQYHKDILFTGYQENPASIVSKCDVYALSSNFEGFPNALVEAMACAIPCVATACKSGPCELFIENYSQEIEPQDVVYADYGILVPQFQNTVDFHLESMDDTHRIYANALEIMLNNAEVREKYSKSAKIRMEFFDKYKILQQTKDILNS